MPTDYERGNEPCPLPEDKPVPGMPDFSQTSDEAKCLLYTVLLELRDVAAAAAAQATANAAAASKAEEMYRYEGRALAWEEAGRLFTTMQALLGKEGT